MVDSQTQQPVVGILALQGSFAEHQQMLSQLLPAENIRLVKSVAQLGEIDRLIIPGGESTAIRIIAEDRQLLSALKEFVRDHYVWGTCAGLILLADTVTNEAGVIGGIAINAERNAFGSQQDSFISELEAECLLDVQAGEGAKNRSAAFEAVFIRAPKIVSVGIDVKVLTRLKDEKTIVAARNQRVLVTAFHPELTADLRWHRYFVDFY